MKENDIVIKRISSEEELWFAERLYLSSFPDGERREIADWGSLVAQRVKDPTLSLLWLGFYP